jgi:hypothetical protein
MKIIIKMNDDSNQEGDFLPRSPYIIGGQSRNNSEQFRMAEEQKEEVDFEERGDN